MESLTVGGTVLATQTVRASPITLAFLNAVIFAGLNVVFGGAYLLRKGMVRQGIAPWRWRRKYPWRFYAPWGGGQHGRYFTSTVVGFTVAMVFWYGKVQLVHRQLPISTAEFLGWMSQCWLAIALVRKAFPRFRWSKLGVPAIGVFQAVGALVAAGLLLDSRFSLGMIIDPIVLGLLAASIASAWQRSFAKETRLQEEAFFMKEAFFQSREHPFTPEDHLFFSAKLTFWPAPMRFAWCLAGFLVAGWLTGFPHVGDWGLLWGAIGYYAVSAFGGRISGIAMVEGDPALNGIAATGGLGFSFIWVWVFQNIGVRPFQLVGALMTVMGAMALAFTHENVRVRAKSWWRRRFGKEDEEGGRAGGKHA